MAVRAGVLPDGALLRAYARNGHYTDCWIADVGGAVTHARYVEAFYTTWVFRLERGILRLAVARPSTDAQAAQLGAGAREAFAAWSVEGRAPDQLLLRDEVTGRTRSWLMTQALAAGGTRLYFGSAVVRERDGRLAPRFNALLGFHALYSRILLGAARRRLQ